jgi:hypothetical protein
VKKDLIQEWEAQTGQSWPTYRKDIPAQSPNATGKMGKQIGFYMTLRDEESFIAALQDQAHVLVTLNYSPTAEPVVLDPLPLAGPKIGDNTNLSIYSMDINPKLIVRKLSGRDGYSLDVTRSEVIQINRCFIRTDGKLEPGRLWYDHETMQCNPKRKVFLSWAQTVFQLIKNNYHYSQAHHRYFGPDAETQFEAEQVALAPF